MAEEIKHLEHFVFGLDIGTRSIVGTVGYAIDENNFKVLAQVVKMHETRAMLDGQIHDIGQVTKTIKEVKKELEYKIDRKLTEVCIAAAGRVLKTVTVTSEYELPSEMVINSEHIHSLELICIEKAYDVLKEEMEGKDLKLHCVGYTVIKYFLNGYEMSNLEGHKGRKISAQLIATFLPDEVIDGLYASIEKAGLQVANLTLEPIAAIQVAIPVQYRLLNLALVDVGAGTSDICVTKDGSITAYGMIPYAGDEFTEEIVKKYLVEFKVAEEIKTACLQKRNITYKDIIGISHRVSAEEVLNGLSDTVEKITKSIADKIVELNGNKSVSAVFIVGGGGKLPGFGDKLAAHLGLQKERVALRGEEVLQNVEFVEKDIKKDALLVTPIGICLNYYENNNNFILVSINGEKIKLYDNNKLTIMDSALQIRYPNEKLFPQRGKEIHYTINEEKRLVRGEPGEGARIMLNGKKVGINHPITSDDVIEIIPSTAGKDAELTIQQLQEYKNKGTISIYFNTKKVSCSKLVMVNGTIVTEYYEIQENDKIEILDYYTLKQLLEFMGIEEKCKILVNNIEATLDEKIYDNFSVECIFGEKAENEIYQIDEQEENAISDIAKETKEARILKENVMPKEIQSIGVTVNNKSIILSNKTEYILVDVLNVYPFDTSEVKGSLLVTKINGFTSKFTDKINENDRIEIYWK